MSFLDRICELEISGMSAAISREATMAHLKLFILGQPRLEHDGRLLELRDLRLFRRKSLTS
jgi:hypothetical protein